MTKKDDITMESDCLNVEFIEVPCINGDPLGSMEKDDDFDDIYIEVPCSNGDPCRRNI